ncbi:NTP transferase domain-containing protein [Clostridium butyricum]|uniref:phosphocholine cytidylyltransferase family protein n=1 Tax=Clostridium butyricum TaxID=1492 RepID=UPI003D349FA0
MKLIILAAGQGTRLAPLTNTKPKCLVELKGIPLIEWQISVAKNIGIKDIIVLRGYKGEQLEYLKDLGITLIDNFEYKSTNMVETLFKATDYLNDEVIISYGDIVYEEDVLKKVLESESNISVVVDHGWKEYWKLRVEDIFSDAESLILDDLGRIKNIGQKVKDIQYIQGQYIGLTKFKKEGLNVLKQIYDEEKKAFENGKNYICKIRNLKNIYMTDVIQGLINEGNEVKEVSINRGWVEIDNIHDLEVANKLISYVENRFTIS